VELGSANHSEQLVLVWRRGHKVVSTQPAAVVEMLDLCSGSCKLEVKHSQLELHEPSGSIVCSVPLELSQHTGVGGDAAGAASDGANGTLAKPLVLILPDGLGTLRLALAARRCLPRSARAAPSCMRHVVPST
jgi:hypothetical protein